MLGVSMFAGLPIPLHKHLPARMGLKELPDDEFDMEQIAGPGSEIEGPPCVMQAFVSPIGTRAALGFPAMLAVLDGCDDEGNLAPVED